MIMYFDGTMNECFGNGIDVVITFPNRKQYPILIKLQFNCTNNIVDYETCMHKLEVVSKMLFKKLYVYKDSMLIIFQVNGEWQTKNEKLRPYQENLTKLIEDFDKIKFTYLNRDKNQFPDALTTLASMAKINCGIKVQLICIQMEKKSLYMLFCQEGNKWKAFVS